MTVIDLADPPPLVGSDPTRVPQVLPEPATAPKGNRSSRRAERRARLQRVSTVPATLPTAGRLERWGLWIAVAVAYLICGWLQARNAVISGDAISRTLSAANTVTGRDPHLESIGFVWPPFPAFFQIPLVAVSGWFPALLRDGLAGCIVSAILMASMVAAVRKWLEECGVNRPTRLAFAVALAANPFILLFSGNGMSEASMLCFLVIAANRLSRWWERETPLDLIACGVALAMAYLSRYEVGLAIILVSAAVFAEAARRATGDLRSRARRGLVAAASVAFIPLSAAAVWAGWSWATIGEAFAQFTSQYGNSAIVAGQAVKSGMDRLVLFVTQGLIFGGVVIVIIAAGIWFGTRGFARVVSVMLVLLSPFAFNLAAAYSGTTFGFARFTITLIPAGVMLAGPLVVSLARDGSRRAVAGGAAVAMLAAFVVLGAMSLPVLWDGRYGTTDESVQMTALPGPYRNPDPLTKDTHIEAMREIADDIDAMDLPEDSVLTDDFTSYLIVLSSDHRTQYITTPDRDFERVLSAPRIFGVKYMLVPDSKNSNYDAVRDVWPGVFDGLNPIGKPVEEWGDASNPARHYRLIKISPKGTPGS